ncbi:MAG: DMT family transporter [Paracoccaceae bacterium]
MSVPSCEAPPIIPRRWLAVAAVLFTVAIWANFLVTAGGVIGAGFGVVELGFLRAAVCTAALSPVLWRIGLYPKGLEFWRFLVMVLGASISFMFVMPMAFRYAPAADSGVFAPGMMPLWVAALSWMFLGERINRLRLVGFALIATGVLAVGGWEAISNAGDGAWRGYILFASSSLFFSCFAIAQRGSGLTALEATAMISAWSLPIAAIAALAWGADFTTVSVEAIAWTVIAQFSSGVVAIVTFAYAINRLGASKAAAFIALTPAVVALASDLFLGEPARPLTWIGIAVVSIGVLIASGAVGRRDATT